MHVEQMSYHCTREMTCLAGDPEVQIPLDDHSQMTKLDNDTQVLGDKGRTWLSTSTSVDKLN